ncbi:MAG: 16S rRNA (uracil(1498)-N(3))-methyltransferase [Methylococcales bacterium]|nr:16S rRNA (uracil(1498)-N(3))-methyltransferase [Methylococcales bacterium]
MRISRLYTAAALQTGKTIELDDDNAHYARSVLRLKNDAPIILFNGTGGEYVGKVVEVSRKSVHVELKQHVERSVESNLKICLGLGISRGDRMDFSVQKAVELGVTAITPLITERCVVQFKDEKKSQRWQHWQKIIQHAAEQSGRTVLPDFSDVSTLNAWVTGQGGLKVFLDPYAEMTLAQLTPENNSVTLLTGPEGGFSSAERETAKAAGFIPVRLGARILRTETASLAALSAVQMLWGDFK